METICNNYNVPPIRPLSKGERAQTGSSGRAGKRAGDPMAGGAFRCPGRDGYPPLQQRPRCPVWSLGAQHQRIRRPGHIVQVVFQVAALQDTIDLYTLQAGAHLADNLLVSQPLDISQGHTGAGQAPTSSPSIQKLAVCRRRPSVPDLEESGASLNPRCRPGPW